MNTTINKFYKRLHDQSVIRELPELIDCFIGHKIKNLTLLGIFTFWFLRDFSIRVTW